MKNRTGKLILSAFTSGMLLFSASAFTAETPMTKADIEALVKQVIRDNPELILETVNDYQKKKQSDMSAKAAKNIVAMQEQLKNDPLSPSVGNPAGDVTLVEFFDYHCGYCKQFLPTIIGLVNEDTKLRLVFKEFPILSEDSRLAAKAALTVNKIDKNKYLTYHTALMKMSTGFTMENLTAKAEEIGVNGDAFKKEMADPALDTEIAKTKELAYALDISGTPAIVIGTDIAPGAMPLGELKARIAAARAKKQ